jgi:hypothetical protein
VPSGGASWFDCEGTRYAQHGNGAGLPITVYNQTIANIGYFRNSTAGVRLDGRFDNFNYWTTARAAWASFRTTIATAMVARAARLGYEFLPGYEVWVRGSLNQRTYFQLDSSGLDRGSYGFDVVGGILIDLGAVTSVELFAGYLQQNFVNNQFATISVPTFGLTGYWNPIRELWIKPFVRRSR